MEQTKINVAFSLEQMNIVLAGLSELPLKVSGDLFAALKQESERQIKEATKPVPKTPKAAK